MFEVEALPPADLQRVVSEAIDSVLDIEAFNAELDAERKDAAFLQGVRGSMKDRFADLDFERGPETDDSPRKCHRGSRPGGTMPDKDGRKA